MLIWILLIRKTIMTRYGKRFCSFVRLNNAVDSKNVETTVGNCTSFELHLNRTSLCWSVWIAKLSYPEGWCRTFFQSHLVASLPTFNIHASHNMATEAVGCEGHRKLLFYQHKSWKLWVRRVRAKKHCKYFSKRLLKSEERTIYFHTQLTVATMAPHEFYMKPLNQP